MRFKNLVIISLILFVNVLTAQSDFRPGYIILNSYDTVFGKVDSRGDILMSKSCRFKRNNSDSIIIFRPSDLIEFRFIDGKCYVSRVLESGTLVFLEYLINGKLNIYYYRDEEGKDYYLVDKKDLPLRVISFKEEIRFKDDGTRVLYQSKYHVGLLMAFTNDVDNFKKEAIKIIKPDHNNLIKFAKDYHNLVCKDENCIIYDKNVPFIKASFELFYGQTSLNDKYLIDNSIKTSAIGSFFYFWMPRMNERFYFKTGYQRFQIDYNGGKFIYHILPTQIQYQYPHFSIKPKLFYGYNNYFANKSYSHWTIALGGGLDYRFSNRISLTSNYTAEFVPISIKIMEGFMSLDSESITFLSYSIYFGLRIDL